MNTFIYPAQFASVAVSNGSGMFARAENPDWNNPDSLHFVGADIRYGEFKPELKTQVGLDIYVRRMFEAYCRGKKITEDE